MSTATVPRLGSTPYRDATRALSSLLSPMEKRLLIWIASRLPRWVNSDHLTVLALVAMVGAGLSYWWASRSAAGLALAAICLAINWFGDSLDGTLARVRDQQRPRYGFYVDHLVDEIGCACLLAGLGMSGYMSAAVAAAVLIAYFMLCLEVFLATHVLGTFRMSYFKVGPTELRILLATGNLVALVHPRAAMFGHDFLLFDVGGVVACAALLVTLGYSAVSNTRRLYLAEPIPERARS